MSHEITTRLSEMNLKGRGTLLLSPRIAAEITALHNACGRDEWSGILVFEPIVEEIVDCSKYVARAIAIYPMHFGNSTYTEYGVGTEILDLYEKFPEADPSNGTPKYRLAQIHSHHNMSTFFSGTDDQELRDNAGKYDYYLSLIVNFDGKYMAKIAFEAEMPQDIKKGNITIPLAPKQILAMFTLDVQMEVEEWFQDMVDDLKVSHKKTMIHSSPVSSQFRTRDDSDDDDYWNWAADRRGESRPLGFQHTPQQQPGTHKGKKDEEKAKTRMVQPEEKTIGKVTLKEDAIKKALPDLFLENSKDAQEVTFFFLFENHPLRDATEAQISQYIGRLKGRLEPWLEKHFGAEILASHGMMEEYILGRTLDLVRLYTVDTPVAQAIFDFLDKYIERNYNKDEGMPRHLSDRSEY